ncbi:MAG: 50S ribosomal protein L23 [Candidatus Uhrbacteria bacterium]|nr:50S ribosomal protein L23 [Candidatus Uhrbacteria bacterium]
MGIFKKNNSKAIVPKVAKEKTDAPVSETKKLAAFVSSVLIRPIVTEKSAILASKNSYVFAVAKSANKIEVAAAIRKMYGMLPESVNIQNVRGKYVRRGKVDGHRKAWKKAIVTLPKGKTLNIYEGV